MLDKSGACKALKNAYATGYQIMPGKEYLTLRAGTWTACVRINVVPEEVSQMIVTQVGYLPTICELIRKNRQNQIMLGDELDMVQSTLQEYQSGALRMRKLPIIFRGKWQIYMDEDGQVWAYDTELLAIMDKDVPAQCYAAPWGLGIWEYGSESVMIAPACFSAEDQRALERMAEIFAEGAEDAGEDEAETMCLFEPEEGENE